MPPKELTACRPALVALFSNMSGDAGHELADKMPGGQPRSTPLVQPYDESDSDCKIIDIEAFNALPHWDMDNIDPTTWID